MLRYAILLILCGFGFAGFYPAVGAPLSDAEARKTIEDYFNAGVEYFPVGTFLAEGGQNNLDQGRISVGLYHQLSGVASLGLITVAELPQATGPFGVPLTPPHIFSKRIRVALTDKGRAVSQWKRPANWEKNYELLGIRIGTFSIRRIIKNEETKRGIDEFRIVFATYTADWAKDYLTLSVEVQKAVNLGEGLCANCRPPLRFATNRKARLLLKRDDFKNSWAVVSHDFANEDEDFTTDHVNTKLK